MRYLKEVTTWDEVDYNVPSHTYIINRKQELIGYIKEGTKEKIFFKHPIKQFSKSRRKFEDVTNKLFSDNINCINID